MPDREKVIKGLEICKSTDKTCSDCPYNGEICTTSLCDDVLAMMKDDELYIQHQRDGYAELEKEYQKLLKENEAVKPQLSMSGLWYECPICHRHLLKGKDNYCARCGRQVKWE